MNEMHKAIPRAIVDDFLLDKITKSQFIELAELNGESPKQAFASAEKLEYKLKWKGIKELKNKSSSRN